MVQPLEKIAMISMLVREIERPRRLVRKDDPRNCLIKTAGNRNALLLSAGGADWDGWPARSARPTNTQSIQCALVTRGPAPSRAYRVNGKLDVFFDRRGAGEGAD